MSPEALMRSDQGQPTTPPRPDQIWLVVALMASAVVATVLITSELDIRTHRLVTDTLIGVWVIYAVLLVGADLRQRIDRLAARIGKDAFDRGYVAGARDGQADGTVVPIRSAR